MARRRVGVLTFHMAHNYGAMLQAYALPKALNKLGVDCETIDYRFSYIDSWSRIERLNDLIATYGLLRGVKGYIRRLVQREYWGNTMRHKFDRFERKVMCRSKKIYRSKADLNNMHYDVILFGSDQIWNSKLTDGVADEYVGSFMCYPHTRKISYAASCGTSDFQEESRDVYCQYLRRFYAVSVREEGLKNALVGRGINAECVLDPTLLLTVEEWRKLIPSEKRFSEQGYLLVYVFDEDERLYDYIREYARYRKLDIIAIAYEEKKSMHGMNVLTDCGPLEFLGLFSNAEHVITTSFHGTVFSILFHKPFHCITHSRYGERTDSLLRILGMKGNSMGDLGNLEDVEVNWARVDALLEKCRLQSLDFLKKNVVAYEMEQK